MTICEAESLYVLPKSNALVTCTKFKLKILTINVNYAIAYFREITLEISWHVSETTPGVLRCPLD